MVTKRSVFEPESKESVAREYLETGCSMRELCAKHDVNISSVSRRVNIYRKYGKEGLIKLGIKGPFVDPNANKLTAKPEELLKKIQ